MSQPIFEFGDDGMDGVAKFARSAFRYFWREVYWDNKRIVPALDLAMIKLPFSDGSGNTYEDGSPVVEYMWVNEVSFDGQFLSGTLANQPRQLTSVREGDDIQVPFASMVDWLYVMENVAYGGYSINLMRAKMGPEERASHDDAWGLDFCEPHQIRTAIPYEHSKNESFQDHPLCLHWVDRLKTMFKSEPDLLNKTDDRGNTLLHHDAMAGNLATATRLLELGADVHAQNKNGQTPAALAALMGWQPLVDLLSNLCVSDSTLGGFRKSIVKWLGKRSTRNKT